MASSLGSSLTAPPIAPSAFREPARNLAHGNGIGKKGALVTLTVLVRCAVRSGGRPSGHRHGDEPAQRRLARAVMGLDRYALNDGSIKRGQRRGVGTFGQFAFGGGAIQPVLDHAG